LWLDTRKLDGSTSAAVNFYLPPIPAELPMFRKGVPYEYRPESEYTVKVYDSRGNYAARQLYVESNF